MSRKTMETVQENLVAALATMKYEQAFISNPIYLVDAHFLLPTLIIL
jgi:hypothetical protein